MSKKLEKIVKNTVDESEDYMERVRWLMGEIEEKKENMRRIVQDNKKLMLATWLYKVKRRQDQQELVLNECREKTQKARKIDQKAVFCMFFFAVFLIGVAAVLAKSTIPILI